jgi:hypothetical protein
MDEFDWKNIKDKSEIEVFYASILPGIREAAKACGYAIGVHGSMRRDLDLIAIPWIASYSDKETLARAIQKAACGLEMKKYDWEPKPLGRFATCFPVCFPEWHEPSVGHIDLSVLDLPAFMAALPKERGEG